MDAVFFLKSYPTRSVREIRFPNETRLVVIDPPGSGEATSGAFAGLYASLRDSDGRVVPNLLRRYLKGDADRVRRVAFLGFSAAHGFLSPLASVDADRRLISAYILIDATFNASGSTEGKPGYVKFGVDAARGERLMLSLTSNTGHGHLTGNESWKLVWKDVRARTWRWSWPGRCRRPLPCPVGGVHTLGDDLYWYEYVHADGKPQILHWEMGPLIRPALEAYLVPYWEGRVGLSWSRIAGYAAASAAMAAGASRM